MIEDFTKKSNIVRNMQKTHERSFKLTIYVADYRKSEFQKLIKNTF